MRRIELVGKVQSDTWTNWGIEADFPFQSAVPGRVESDPSNRFSFFLREDFLNCIELSKGSAY